MAIVMIRCPETRRAISTGMQVDRATFHSTPVFFSRTYCSLCRTTHEWFAKDAWVCNSDTAVCEPSCEHRVA
jgi:hypothetical protein